MIKSFLEKAVLLAYKRGYCVDKSGNLFNYIGFKMSPYKVVGYDCFSVKDSDKRTNSVGVHRLQAYQKYGNKLFEEGIMVRHKDGNPLNNSWENILIGTHSQNMMDIPLKIRRQKSSHPIYNHKKIIKDRKNGLTYKELMEKYSISSKGTISHIINKSLENEKFK